MLPIAPLLLSLPQQTVPVTEPVRSAVVNPRKLDWNTGMVRRLRAPKGMTVSVFASGLTEPRVLLPLDDGTVLFSSPNEGKVFAVREGGEAKEVLSGLKGAHGLARRGDRVYVAGYTEIMTADLSAGGELRNAKRIVVDLPEPGQHNKRTIGFGPDGMLYLNLGSRSNDRPSPEPKEEANISVMDAAGQGRRVFAKRLRNTLAFAWNPATGEMWGFDHGCDYRGDQIPPDELNRIVDGGDYGWPYVYGKRVKDPNVYILPKGETSFAAYARKTEPAAWELPAHCAPIACAFSGGDLYVTLHGSWNRSKPIGYRVDRIRFDASGRPAGEDTVLDGFLVDGGRAFFGRPAGLAVLADGSMLVGDDANGVIYRLARG